MKRWFASLGVRLLAFNLLLTALPVGSIFFLNTYEQQQLAALERSMVQQGRLLASALDGLAESGGSGGTAGPAGSPDSPSGSPPAVAGFAPGLGSEARRILSALNHRTESRIRVIDSRGRVLADSALLPSAEPVEEEAAPELSGSAYDTRSAEAGAAGEASPRDDLLYRIALVPVELARNIFGRPDSVPRTADFYLSGNYLEGPEIQAALAGRYGARTRISPEGQRSVSLYSAIPVFSGDKVPAVVLVSQSTTRILRDMYQLRIDIFIIILWSVAGAGVLSLLVSGTITRPIRRLAREAAQIVDHRGRLERPLSGSSRKDEIGELARSYADLTMRSKAYSDHLEHFASDVSHEIRNPLAGIRSLAELMQESEQTDSPVREQAAQILEECHRIDRRIRALAELSRLEGRLEQEERGPVDMPQLLRRFVGRMGDPLITLQTGEEPLRVMGMEDRISQILENLTGNARDFSPAGSPVEIILEREEHWARIEIRDRGPAIPEARQKQIFSRFYSQRDGSDGRHSGLGLAISRTIAEALGGNLGYQSEPVKAFVLRLPLS